MIKTTKPIKTGKHVYILMLNYVMHVNLNW